MNQAPLQSFRWAVDGGGDFFEMGRGVRAEKLTADIEIAGQFLLGDEILDKGEGGMPFGDNGAGGGGTMGRRQIVETGFEPGANQPAVARRASPAGAFSV